MVDERPIVTPPNKNRPTRLFNGAISEADINLVMIQTGVTYSMAAIALRRNRGDIVDAIIELVG
jgi:NACalpha-BTF3-like transcription factor